MTRGAKLQPPLTSPLCPSVSLRARVREGIVKLWMGLSTSFSNTLTIFLSTTPPPLITDGALVGGVKAMPSYNCTNCGAEEIFLYETPSAHLILRIIEQGKACNSTQALLLKALEPITTPMEEVMGMSIEREAGSSTQDLLKALEPITTPDELALV